MFQDRIEFLPNLWLTQSSAVVPVVRETAEFVGILRSLQWQNCLDLGTGTGALALSLADLGPVTAVDIDPQALALAEYNSRELNRPIQTLRSDWFDHCQGHWDLIVTHPPHERDSIWQASPELLKQRLRADQICGGPDGLDHVRKIIAGTDQHLRDQGHLALIVDRQRAQEVRALMSALRIRARYQTENCELILVQKS